MKIYTRRGDAGQTDLLGGPRVDKDAARIEACGDVDELNACLGVARCEALPPAIETLLTHIQHQLFELGAELACPQPERLGVRMLADASVTALEEAIDEAQRQLAPLAQFVLPAGSRAAALIHVARATCRRAERRLVTLSKLEPLGPTPLAYLNRLGDLLFVWARLANATAGVGDTPWRH